MLNTTNTSKTDICQDLAEECLMMPSSQAETGSEEHPFINSEERIVRTQPKHPKSDGQMTEAQIRDYLMNKYKKLMTKYKATKKHGAVVGLPKRPNV